MHCGQYVDANLLSVLTWMPQRSATLALVMPLEAMRARMRAILSISKYLVMVVLTKPVAHFSRNARQFANRCITVFQHGELLGFVESVRLEHANDAVGLVGANPMIGD